MQDINDAMDKLFKRSEGIMLESELSKHLGYDKDSVDGHENRSSRNGMTRKLIESGSGEVIIEVPRDSQDD